jgi:putative transposase
MSTPLRTCKIFCVNGHCRLQTVTTGGNYGHTRQIARFLDEGLQEPPEDLLGETGLLKQLTKQLLERAMQTEMTEHLGYEKHVPVNKQTDNSRNGTYKKQIKGEFGNLEIAVPRDRNSSFEPIILPKGQSRFSGFDDKIIALYARGMTTRDIQAHLEEMYGVEVSPSLVSQVTRAVQEEVTLWQNRPLAGYQSGSRRSYTLAKSPSG